MLSKSAFFILGLLKETSINPYEVLKTIEKLSLTEWSGISQSSIYATFRTLVKSGYITGSKSKDSAMPEKTIYSITTKGLEAFDRSFEEYLTDRILEPIEFNLASLFITLYDRKTVLSLLDIRKSRIHGHISAINAKIESFGAVGIPDYVLISLKHNNLLMEAELKTVEQLLMDIENDGRWNHTLMGSLK